MKGEPRPTPLEVAMRRHALIGAAVGLVFSFGLAAQTASQDQQKKQPPDWSLNATNIEACSCQVFCSCYFVGGPTPATPATGGHEGHAAGGEKFCRFNNAFKINSGHWGDTKLDGLKFWMAGDLGSDFSKGFDWAALHFEPGATPQQRDAVKQIVHQLFPGQWKSFSDGKDAKIDWVAMEKQASAKLDDGKAAEVQLKAAEGTDNQPVEIRNLKFWASPRNDGVKVMPNQLQVYRVGDKTFETKGTNGFVVTIDMNSNDVKKPT
jgi:hypothetical protein